MYMVYMCMRPKGMMLHMKTDTAGGIGVAHGATNMDWIR